MCIRDRTLGDSQILSQLAAFFMCILSPIFLKEKLPKEAIPGLVVISLGTLCVVQIWNFDSFNVYAPVSYTHLDVYKRQSRCRKRHAGGKTHS